MADQEINEHEPADDFERQLAAFAPTGLAIPVGTVMFEAGRAAGLKQSSGLVRSTGNQLTWGWQLATAASLALALVGFSGALDSKPAPTNVAVESASQSDNPIVASPQPDSLIDNLSIESRPFLPQKTVATPNQSMLAMQHKLLNDAFNPRPNMTDVSGGFSYQRPSTVSELMDEYNYKGAF